MTWSNPTISYNTCGNPIYDCRTPCLSTLSLPLTSKAHVHRFKIQPFIFNNFNINLCSYHNCIFSSSASHCKMPNPSQSTPGVYSHSRTPNRRAEKHHPSKSINVNCLAAEAPSHQIHYLSIFSSAAFLKDFGSGSSLSTVHNERSQYSFQFLEKEVTKRVHIRWSSLLLPRISHKPNMCCHKEKLGGGEINFRSAHAQFFPSQPLTATFLVGLLSLSHYVNIDNASQLK